MQSATIATSRRWNRNVFKQGRRDRTAHLAGRSLHLLQLVLMLLMFLLLQMQFMFELQLPRCCCSFLALSHFDGVHLFLPLTLF